MIVNVATDWGTAGPFVEPQSDLGIGYNEADMYGVDGDFDNPERVPYNKMLWQAACIGFPKGREWDGTAEDAIRLHALGVEMILSDDFTDDDVEGFIDI